jgi:hypothetical protein
MGKQPAADGRVRLVLAISEEDVITESECPRCERLGRSGGGSVMVDADIREKLWLGVRRLSVPRIDCPITDFACGPLGRRVGGADLPSTSLPRAPWIGLLRSAEPGERPFERTADRRRKRLSAVR